MDIRGIANGATQSINPNVAITLRQSTGYIIDPTTRKQVPNYTSTPGYGNVQALDGKDLVQLDGLNIQGVLRTLFLYGAAAGVIRPDQRGGDTVTIGGKTWLVVKVLEHWDNPTWAKVAICYQGTA